MIFLGPKLKKNQGKQNKTATQYNIMTIAMHVFVFFGWFFVFPCDEKGEDGEKDCPLVDMCMLL